MEKLIGEVNKTNSVKTIVRLTEFKGHSLLDIRDHFKPKGSQTYTPTRKGICLDISKLSDIITLLEKAEAELAQ
jgi:hypothetical protein